MAARKVTRSKKLTEEANADLERFTRNLAARLNVNVTYSRAVMYAVRMAESAQDWLDETARTSEPVGVSPIAYAVEQAMAELKEGKS